MIDTHAHLFLCHLPTEQLIQNAIANGLTGIINVALDIPTAMQALEVHRQFPIAYPTIGLYPSCCEKPYDLAVLKQLASQHPFKAIGEIGLDQYHKFGTPDSQMTLFSEQLKIADELNLPVIVHNRLTDQEMHKVFSEFRTIRKVFHCFSSSYDFAQTQLELCEDTYFSFTGLITLSQGKEMHDIIKKLPLNRIMLETDCPYLTPLRFKGEKNQPAYVGEVASEIATILGLTRDEIVDITTQNTIRFFNL
jgi:TatD DNase family protein